MPKIITIDYKTSHTLFNAEDLSNTAMMTQVADEITQCVTNSLKAALDTESPFQDIYIEGYHLATVVDALLGNPAADPITHNRLCALLISGSQADGSPIFVMNSASDQPSKFIDWTGEFPYVQGDITLNFFDKLLAFFGFSTEKIKAFEKMQEIGQNAVQMTLFNNAHKEAALHNAHFQKFKEYGGYTQKIKNAAKIGLDQYFGNLKEEIKSNNAFSTENFDGNVKVEDLKSVGNYISRSVDTIVTCMMLMRNHSLKDIIDPSFTTDREAVGRELLQIVNDIAGSDPAAKRNAEEKLANVYVEGAKKFLQQEMPPEKDLKDFTHSENPMYAYTIMRIGHDMAQEFNRDSNKTTYIMTKPENHILLDKISSASYLGDMYAMSKAMSANWNDFDTALENNSTLNIALQKQIADATTDYSGKTIDDFVCLNQGEAFHRQVACRSAFSEFIDRFDPESENKLSAESFFNGKIDIIEEMKQGAIYASALIGSHEEQDEASTYEQREARTNLVKKAVDVMLLDNKDTTLQSTKDQMACVLLDKDVVKDFFKGKTVEELNSKDALVNFGELYVISFAPNQKEDNTNTNSVTSLRHEKEAENNEPHF